jgi:hypothetical protein
MKIACNNIVVIWNTGGEDALVYQLGSQLGLTLELFLKSIRQKLYCEGSGTDYGSAINNRGSQFDENDEFDYGSCGGRSSHNVIGPGASYHVMSEISEVAVYQFL